MRSRFFKFNDVYSGSAEENGLLSNQKVDLIHRRLYWMYDGIFKELSIMNS